MHLLAPLYCQLSRRHGYVPVSAIILTMLLSQVNAMGRHSVEKIGVATTEQPLLVPLEVTKDLLEEPHYLSVTIGEIRSSGRHPPIIRLFISTETAPAKMQAGSPEHLGSLTIFPWPRSGKAPATKAAFNLSRKLTVLSDALRIIPGTSNTKLAIAVAVIPDQREDVNVSVDVLSIEITPTDGSPL